MRIVPYMALLNSRMIGPIPSPGAVASPCPALMNPPPPPAGHAAPATPPQPDNDASGVHQLGGDCRRHPVAHRATGRAELPSRPAVLQKAGGPAAEIAGVAGDDRIVG